MSTSLLHSRAYQYATAKACVFSDSVLCVGKLGGDPVATWKSKIKLYSEYNHFKDMNRIDGMPTEFGWKIFPGIMTLGLVQKIQSLMRDIQCEPENFKGRIKFMSMYNTLHGMKKENQERRSLDFLGAWIRISGTELTLTDLTDHGINQRKI